MNETRMNRQTFLGELAAERMAQMRIGIVGLGGGGSHIAQQFAHLGFERLTSFDGDCIEESNLNRLIGATEADLEGRLRKVDISERLVSGVNRHAEFRKVAGRWQENPDALAECNIIVGCVDGFAEREQLEAFARRHLIPYVDIGLDVHAVPGQRPQMAGQVILSTPGGPCMWCMGFLNEAVLAKEAAKYGDAGPSPQVVWANGVLASTAVGIVVELATGWSDSLSSPVYLSYEANRMTVTPHPRLRFLPQRPCTHYPIREVGAPRFQPL